MIQVINQNVSIEKWCLTAVNWSISLGFAVIMSVISGSFFVDYFDASSTALNGFLCYVVPFFMAFFMMNSDIKKHTSFFEVSSLGEFLLTLMLVFFAMLAFSVCSALAVCVIDLYFSTVNNNFIYQKEFLSKVALFSFIFTIPFACLFVKFLVKPQALFKNKK